MKNVAGSELAGGHGSACGLNSVTGKGIELRDAHPGKGPQTTGPEGTGTDKEKWGRAGGMLPLMFQSCE